MFKDFSFIYPVCAVDPYSNDKYNKTFGPIYVISILVVEIRKI